MLKERNGLFQIGAAIVIVGITIKVALLVGLFLSPLAMWAIIIGAILMVVGLVTPGRGY